MSVSDQQLNDFLALTGCSDIEMAKNILSTTGSFDVA